MIKEPAKDLIKLASQEGSLRRHWAFIDPKISCSEERSLRQPPQKNYFKSKTIAVQTALISNDTRFHDEIIENKC